MSIYTTLPEEDPILSPQTRAAVAKKQQRAYLFGLMERVKGMVFKTPPHQPPIPAVEQAVMVTARNRPIGTPVQWGRCSMCDMVGAHHADCPCVGVSPR